MGQEEGSMIDSLQRYWEAEEKAEEPAETPAEEAKNN